MNGLQRPTKQMKTPWWKLFWAQNMELWEMTQCFQDCTLPIRVRGTLKYISWQSVVHKWCFVSLYNKVALQLLHLESDMVIPASHSLTTRCSHFILAYFFTAADKKVRALPVMQTCSSCFGSTEHTTTNSITNSGKMKLQGCRLQIWNLNATSRGP